MDDWEIIAWLVVMLPALLGLGILARSLFRRRMINADD
jgi:hypothetical protein